MKNATFVIVFDTKLVDKGTMNFVYISALYSYFLLGMGAGMWVQSSIPAFLGGGRAEYGIWYMV